MKNLSTVKVFSPATVANVACAFDVLGFALESVGDLITAHKTKVPGVKITKIISPYGELSLDPKHNTASVAAQTLLKNLDPGLGFELEIEKQMPIGSGLGSSAASAAGAVFALNELLNRPFTQKELITFAMEGERVAAGVAHADNVAPALLGGFTLVRQGLPLDVVKIPFPEQLVIAVVCPLIEVRTEDARKILKKLIPFKRVVEQFGNIAGLVAGLCQKDLELIGRSLQDVIIEPERAILIPGFKEAKQSALDAGALGCSISGSGPALFAFCKDLAQAQKVADALALQFKKIEIDSLVFTSAINRTGCAVVEGQ
ncbi:homoserine kinase [bacterium]|nr:homoserine kinase [bacterium]